MSRVLRASLFLAAVVAAALAFAVLRPEPATVSDPPPASETPVAAVDDRPSPSPTPSPTAKAPLLKAGSVRKLAVRQGETVSFRVRHPSDEELHVHGYDIARPLPAGKTVAVSFPATIEGIFEVELEQSHTQIASLRVEP